MTKRKKYSKEFKLDAISLVLEQGYTRIEAARSLEINANMLRRWIKEHQTDDDGQAFRGNGKLNHEQEEIRKLKAQVKQLELEKKILKEKSPLVGWCSQENNHNLGSTHFFRCRVDELRRSTKIDRQ